MIFIGKAHSRNTLSSTWHFKIIVHNTYKVGQKHHLPFKTKESRLQVIFLYTLPYNYVTELQALIIVFGS